MKVTGTIEYTQHYFPSKTCQTPRIRVLKKDVPLEIKEFASEDVPVALRVKGKWRNGQEDDYRLYQGEFYCPARDLETEKSITVERLIGNLNYLAKCWIDSDDDDFDEHRSVICSSQSRDHDSEEVKTEFLKSKLRSFLLIDGVLYKRTGEPYYAIFSTGEVCVYENSNFVTTLGSNEYNALERNQMQAHRILSMHNKDIKVMPGFEKYIQLRRHSDREQ